MQKQELIKLEKENKKRLERRKKKGLDNPKTVSANKKKADMLDANIDPSKLKKMVTFKIQNWPLERPDFDKILLCDVQGA